MASYNTYLQTISEEPTTITKVTYKVYSKLTKNSNANDRLKIFEHIITNGSFTTSALPRVIIDMSVVVQYKMTSMLEKSPLTKELSDCKSTLDKYRGRVLRLEHKIDVLSGEVDKSTQLQHECATLRTSLNTMSAEKGKLLRKVKRLENSK